MADIVAIAQGKAYQKAFGVMFGIEPRLDIEANRVHVYYEPDKLQLVQKKVLAMSEKESQLQVDFLQMLTPLIIKNSAIPLLAVFGAGFYLGGKK